MKLHEQESAVRAYYSAQGIRLKKDLQFGEIMFLYKKMKDLQLSLSDFYSNHPALEKNYLTKKAPLKEPLVLNPAGYQKITIRY